MSLRGFSAARVAANPAKFFAGQLHRALEAGAWGLVLRILFRRNEVSYPEIFVFVLVSMFVSVFVFMSMFVLVFVFGSFLCSRLCSCSVRFCVRVCVCVRVRVWFVFVFGSFLCLRVSIFLLHYNGNYKLK